MATSVAKAAELEHAKKEASSSTGWEAEIEKLLEQQIEREIDEQCVAEYTHLALS